VRVESVARAPDYRESFRLRRCLVVVDGFYEWKPTEGKKGKQPFFVRREDDKPFALAGIWSQSHTADGEVLDACGIITGPSQGVVAPLHDRMPLVIPKASLGLWLSTELRSQEALALMDRETHGLVSHPVGRWVNVAANDDPRCIERVDTT
jgi:putative SOS response-associated peptidase YedK